MLCRLGVSTPRQTHFVTSIFSGTMLGLYLKSFLLTSSAILSFAALIPPKRASERTQKLYTGQLFEYLVRSLAYTACVRITSSLRPPLN